jgi:uncharacterized protein YcaQ
VKTAVREIDLATARRLAVDAQRLSGPVPRSSPSRVLEVIRSIRCVQLDPISVVARSPLLVLRSRLGGFEPRHLDRLLWRDRSLYEYWAHAASIVLTEDHQIHAWYMRRYLDEGSTWDRRLLEAGREREAAPLDPRSVATRWPAASRALDGGPAPQSWRMSGWSNERNVERILSLLWGMGDRWSPAAVGRRSSGTWPSASCLLKPREAFCPTWR